jgi:hypothetical protein
MVVFVFYSVISGFCGMHILPTYFEKVPIPAQGHARSANPAREILQLQSSYG